MGWDGTGSLNHLTHRAPLGGANNADKTKLNRFPNPFCSVDFQVSQEEDYSQGNDDTFCR